MRPTAVIEVLNGNIERAILDLKRWWAFDGIGKELRFKEAYMTPLQKRKLKDRASTRRRKRLEAKLRAKEERHGRWRRK